MTEYGLCRFHRTSIKISSGPTSLGAGGVAITRSDVSETHSGLPGSKESTFFLMSEQNQMTVKSAPGTNETPSVFFIFNCCLDVKSLFFYLLLYVVRGARGQLARWRLVKKPVGALCFLFFFKHAVTAPRHAAIVGLRLAVLESGCLVGCFICWDLSVESKLLLSSSSRDKMAKTEAKQDTISFI